MTEKKELPKKVTLPEGAVMGVDVAEQELEKWHSFRKVKESRRNIIDLDLGHDATRKMLIEGFEYGCLVFDKETGILKQILQFPFQSSEGSLKVSELNYKPRVRRNALIDPMKGVKNSDTEGRTKAWISAVTDTDKAFVGKLDLSDFALTESIIMYFLT